MANYCNSQHSSWGYISLALNSEVLCQFVAWRILKGYCSASGGQCVLYANLQLSHGPCTLSLLIAALLSPLRKAIRGSHMNRLDVVAGHATVLVFPIADLLLGHNVIDF